MCAENIFLRTEIRDHVLYIILKISNIFKRKMDERKGKKKGQARPRLNGNELMTRGNVNARLTIDE